MPFYAEHLPSEIWLYIFSFIEGHDLVRTFTHLNVFFDSLLRSSHLQLYIRIKKDESYQQLPVSTWSHISRQNIYSLGVGHRKTNSLIPFLRWNATYLVRLHCLSVYLRKANIYSNIQILTLALQQIPSLHCLRIKHSAGLDPHAYYFEPLMTYIFSARSSIQQCSFNFGFIDNRMDTSKWSSNPSLKYLYIDRIAWIDLFLVLTYTPQLHSLQVVIHQFDVIPHNEIILASLTEAKLYISDSRFIHLENFKQIVPNLQSLQIRGTFNSTNADYFNEDSWYKLFRNIKRVDVHIHANRYYPFESEIFKDCVRKYHEKHWFGSSEKETYSQIFIRFVLIH